MIKAEEARKLVKDSIYVNTLEHMLEDYIGPTIKRKAEKGLLNTTIGFDVPESIHDHGLLIQMMENRLMKYGYVVKKIEKCGERMWTIDISW
jgi:hypothetical protein